MSSQVAYEIFWRPLKTPVWSPKMEFLLILLQKCFGLTLRSQKSHERYVWGCRIWLSGRISSPLLYYSITMAKTDRPSFFWWYSKSYCIWGICNTRPYTSVFGTISPNLSERARKYFDHRMLIYYKDQYVINQYMRFCNDVESWDLFLSEFTFQKIKTWPNLSR